ncbi:hypothetical protein AAU61_05510 [Desulfocarbo indianensis]|nr:hypothetical protein AAU61_05510 [Desulfocarbo indianensis]
MKTVIYYGSYPISLALLKSLCQDPRFRIEMVVTAPAHGIAPRPVLEWLNAGGLPFPVLTPASLKAGSRPIQLERAAADLVLACAYSLKIPKSLRDKAYVAALNVHPSLLPRYRGADPLRRAIMAGENQTGITLLKLSDEFDSGEIHAQWSIGMKPGIDLGELYRSLTELCVSKVPDALHRAASRMDSPTPQASGEATYAPPVTDEERRIRPGLAADRADRIVRANHPMTPAYVIENGRRLFLAPGEFAPQPAPSSLFEINAGRLVVAGSKGIAKFNVIQASR